MFMRYLLIGSLNWYVIMNLFKSVKAILPIYHYTSYGYLKAAKFYATETTYDLPVSVLQVYSAHTEGMYKNTNI